MRNWVYYMQKGLQSMWKKKEVPDYRTITDEVKFNTSGVPKDFKDREFKGAFKDCGCLPDCGCKDTYKPDDSQVTVFDT